MVKRLIALAVLATVVTAASNAQGTAVPGSPKADTVIFDGEHHFANVRQLTFGGDNAEAYWSYDGKYLVFQKTNPKEGVECDQIWMGKVPASGEAFNPKLVSTGTGRTTCSFFYPGGKYVLYASTHGGNKACPPVPDRQKLKRYIWPIYEDYDIYKADTNGKIVKKLTRTKGYDAEATISPKGDRIVFTSMRDGDLELYTMDLNGKNVKRITSTPGYDGGACFSPDGKKIVWRASRPRTPEELADYKSLLAQNMVAPTNMEVWVANADGSDAHAVTALGQANWAPNFLPDGRIIFCSNHEYKRGFPFNMYTCNTDGSRIEKISRDKGFDAFPMFSADGKKIVFCSNRNNGGTRDTNIFVADWVE